MDDEQQMPPSIPQDIENYAANNMSEAGPVVAMPQAVEMAKMEVEVQVPLPSLPQDTAPYPMHPSTAGMGALANAAAGKVEQETIKRPAEPMAELAGPVVKKQRTDLGAPGPWESLMTQVRGHLRAMSSDECFSRALELQMLARSEVGNRSQHLSNAMDLMANGGASVNPPEIKPRTVPRNQPNLSLAAGQGGASRVTKAEREVSKQKPIKTNKAAPVPCMKMTPPLPPRCEVDNAPSVELPAFCQLVNFPTARYYGNCVMCDESEFSIPKQNKGVCNNCDVAIWVVNPSGMNIKWCKGCKNFRKWIDFGVKGYSSKCERCRCQQATRYANQKNKEIPGQPLMQLPPVMGAPPPPGALPQAPPPAMIHAPVVPPMQVQATVDAAAVAAAAATAAAAAATI